RRGRDERAFASAPLARAAPLQRFPEASFRDAALVPDLGARRGVAGRGERHVQDRGRGGSRSPRPAPSDSPARASGAARDADARGSDRRRAPRARNVTRRGVRAAWFPAEPAPPRVDVGGAARRMSRTSEPGSPEIPLEVHGAGRRAVVLLSGGLDSATAL